MNHRTITSDDQPAEFHTKWQTKDSQLQIISQQGLELELEHLNYIGDPTFQFGN